MNIRPIRTEKDYEAALKQIEELMDIAQPGSPEEDRLDILATSVQVYEAQECPILPPDPISALEHYLDRQELKRKDLTPYIGNIDMVHEIMNRRRKLTSKMVHKLALVTGIPTTTLDPVTSIPIATLAQSYELNRYNSREFEGTGSQQARRELEPAFA